VAISIDFDYVTTLISFGYQSINVAQQSKRAKDLTAWRQSSLLPGENTARNPRYQAQ
jgi:predicted alpha/beta superfamily hydrolase